MSVDPRHHCCRIVREKLLKCLQVGKKGDVMGALAPDPGARRVEEEFVNAVRGREALTHTDFDTTIK